MSPEYAWRNREGHLARYEGNRVGGTVTVHFIKKNMWYLETALALLEGDEYSEAEKYERNRYLEMEREMHGEKRKFGAEMKATGDDQDDAEAAAAVKRERDAAEEAACKHKSPDEKLQREF